MGVVLCSASFPHTTTSTEHEMTPCWCFFVFGPTSSPYDTRNDTHITTLVSFVLGIISLPYKHGTTPMSVWFHVQRLFSPLRAQNHTNECVISCSASFLSPTIHAEHETIPSLVSFCVRRLFFLPPTKHKATPLLVLFHARILSYPLERTSRGVKYFLHYYLIIIYIYI